LHPANAKVLNDLNFVTGIQLGYNAKNSAPLAADVCEIISDDFYHLWRRRGGYNLYLKNVFKGFR
jgi:hypothetical protein